MTERTDTYEIALNGADNGSTEPTPFDKKVAALRRLVAEHDRCVRELDYGEYGADRLHRCFYDLNQVYAEHAPENTLADLVGIQALRAWDASKNPAQYHRRWDNMSRVVVDVKGELLRDISELEQPPIAEQPVLDEE